jgi:23S rRNA (adenine2503-C2)-methyltransferase
MNTNKNWKINLFNFTNESLINFTKILKEKNFVADQLNNCIYKKCINKFENISNIKKIFLEKIDKISKIEKLQVIKEYIDLDNTIKLIIKTEKNIIETVAIPNSKNHFTICLSSQNGCALNCLFCSTGKNGFYGNLKPYEIINQIILIKEKIDKLFKNKKITNIVFMGMGEPLLNIENVLAFISIINNKNTFNINKKKITISTSGITNKIKILSQHNIQLALSLHSTENKIRSKIMPINRKFPLKSLLNECKKYSLNKNTNLTLEYILIENLNDSDEDVINLIRIAKNIKCKICLIPFNTIPDTTLKSPSIEKIINFQKN